MRILILSWRGPGHPLAGGAEASTHAHTAGWVKAGHEVTLFTSSYPGAKKEENLDGVRIVRRGVDIFGVHLEAVKWYLWGDHLPFDLVVDQFHGIPFFTPLYVRVQKLGFIHEVAQEVWSLNPWPWPASLLPAIVGKLGEPWVFRLFYRQIPFLTVSESTKDDLERFGVERVRVVHNGVSLPEELPAASHHKLFTVTYLSALARDKGVEDAIAAFSSFHSRCPKSQLWVIGKGLPKYLAQLQQSARNLPVKFWGYVSEKQKFNLLARSHVLVNPSIHEGWGLVNIEAGSVGLPVVGYNVAGICDSVKDEKTGLLVAAGQVDQLSQALLTLASDDNLRQKLSRQAKKWSKNFFWSKSVNESLKLIASL